MESDWDHTSALLTLVANGRRDPKKRRPFRIEDFHPFRRKRPAGTPITAKNIGLLKKFFIDPKKERRP